MNYERWNTLLELKEDHNSLGLKGWIFFIVDFPMNIETNKIEYVIAQPTFTGIGVGTGISSFVLKKEKLNELFNIMEKTFNQYSKELEEEYYKKN